jgi:hypothetical protein
MIGTEEKYETISRNKCPTIEDSIAHGLLRRRY